MVADTDLPSASDEEVLTYATAQGRALVTAGVRDFAALAGAWGSQGRSHAGLIYVVTRVFPQDRSFIGAVVMALEELIDAGQAPSGGGEVFLQRAR